MERTISGETSCENCGFTVSQLECQKCGAIIRVNKERLVESTENEMSLISPAQELVNLATFGLIASTPMLTVGYD
jgi:predicted RNA-binding Zn-ribbon protein involved in translation (DUF1610 family)